MFSNTELVVRGCDALFAKLDTFLSAIQNHRDLINPSKTTIPNSYDVTLHNEDYTIGKMLEYHLYNSKYMGDKSLVFCGFNKPHPHIPISLIRIGFAQPVADDTVVASVMIESANTSRKIISGIRTIFAK